MSAPAVHVIGASGRSGASLLRALLAQGRDVVPVVRNAAKFTALDFGLVPRLADLTDPQSLNAALADAVYVVSAAHARHAGHVLAAAKTAEKFVFLGSTRKFTQWPDDHGNGVLAGEKIFLASARPGVMLHPTMIYGAAGENNVQRLAALLRRLPAVPLPAGGRALVQPIYQDDVTDAVLAALNIAWSGPEALVIAGPAPVSYADFIRLVAKAAELPCPRILPLPAALLRLAAPLIGLLPGLPRIGRDEIRRLLEDKAFDISAAQSRLGFCPRPLAEGLALTFAKDSLRRPGLRPGPAGG
jgi:uncharacterized protein YbjT (DUF2867 family)